VTVPFTFAQPIGRLTVGNVGQGPPELDELDELLLDDELELEELLDEEELEDDELDDDEELELLDEELELEDDEELELDEDDELELLDDEDDVEPPLGCEHSFVPPATCVPTPKVDSPQTKLPERTLKVN